jgi:chitin synthase
MHFDPPPETELLIGITMSNEDEELFSQIMYGVMKNIAFLTRRHGSRIWGPESWRKVVVCIVVDGVNQINPKTLEVLAAIELLWAHTGRASSRARLASKK